MHIADGSLCRIVPEIEQESHRRVWHNHAIAKQVGADEADLILIAVVYALGHHGREALPTFENRATIEASNHRI